MSENSNIEITNDLNLDVVKDNFKPPAMYELGEDMVRVMLKKLDLDWLDFEAFMFHRDVFTDNGKKSYLLTNICSFINSRMVSVGSKNIVIPRDKYKSLLQCNTELYILDKWGVDNWEWYQEAMDEFYEEIKHININQPKQ